MNPADIEEHFDSRATRYDNPLTAFIGERELRQIRPFVPAGANVLDYGCGTGRTTLDLLRRDCTVTAYDISHEMLAIAREKASRMGLAGKERVVFLTERTQLARYTWPYITCIGVLDYYPDPLSLLHSLRQHLAPGGRLVVTYPNALSPLAWLYALGSRLTVPATPRTPALARRVALQAGFSVVAQRYAFPAIALLGHTLVLALEIGS